MLGLVDVRSQLRTHCSVVCVVHASDCMVAVFVCVCARYKLAFVVTHFGNSTVPSFLLLAFLFLLP